MFENLPHDSMVDILLTLNVYRELPTKTLAEKSGVHSSAVAAFAGKIDPDKRKRSDEINGWVSLVDQNLVRLVKRDVQGKDVMHYRITKAGRELASKVQRHLESC